MWARAVSYVVHPAIVPFLGVVIVQSTLPFHIPKPLFYFVLTYVLAGTYLFPLIITAGMVKLGFIKSIHLRTRQERYLPFLVTALFYFLTAKTIIESRYPADLAKFILAGSIIMLVQFVFLRWTKLSAHAAGAAAVVTWLIVLSSQYQLNLLVPISMSILGLSLVVSARLKLKAHNMLEIVGGSATGILSILVLYQ